MFMRIKPSQPLFAVTLVEKLLKPLSDLPSRMLTYRKMKCESGWVTCRFSRHPEGKRALYKSWLGFCVYFYRTDY